MEQDAEPRGNKDKLKDEKRWESFKMPYHSPLINLYLVRTSRCYKYPYFLHAFISTLIACGGTAIISLVSRSFNDAF